MTTQKAYMIAECVGDSIYEANTIPFVYLKREWAEFQLNILEQSSEDHLIYKIREVFIVNEGPVR